MKKPRLILAACVVVFGMLSVSYAGETEQLVIVGTGSGISLLTAVGKAFSDQHPGITVTIPKSIGSGGGIRAVGDDEYALGRIARDIAEREKKYGLEQIPLAKMPIVFFVNTRVPITGITAEQACGIFNGNIRNWDEISDGEGNIRVIRREDGDSSLVILQETLPGFKHISLTPRSKTTYTDQETVVECTKQKNAIAFGNWADIKNEEGIRGLSLGGIHPTDENYPHIGVLSIIYKKKNYSGAVKKFIEFMASDLAQKAIINAGGIPME